MTQGKMIDSYLTLQQVSERLQVSSRTVYRWIKSGHLVAFRVGHLFRVSEVELQKFVTSGTTSKEQS